MRHFLFVVGVAVLVGMAKPTFSATTSDVDTANAELAESKAAILAFYPPMAKAKGIGGAATLNCFRTPHGALTRCTLTDESPAGAGFGAAALAIARMSPEDLSVNAPPAFIDAPHPITFTFSPAPAFIEPDLLLRHVIQPYDWLGPTWAARGKDNGYPERARRRRMPGRAVLDCAVLRDGTYADCAVVAEAPAGYDFGLAAISLARMFRSPGLSGQRVITPISFRVPTR